MTALPPDIQISVAASFLIEHVAVWRALRSHPDMKPIADYERGCIIALGEQVAKAVETLRAESEPQSTEKAA
jgi:hypothetical protein